MAIPDVAIGAAIGAIGGLIKIAADVFKKKPHVLWYRAVENDPKSWIVKAGPMSARNCRKQMSALVAAGGYEFARFAIFRHGVNPNK